MKLVYFAQKRRDCAKNMPKSLHRFEYCLTFAAVLRRMLQKKRKINHFIYR